MADHRVLDALAAEMGRGLGLADVESVRRELALVDGAAVETVASGSVAGASDQTGTTTRQSSPPAAPAAGQAGLATRRQLLDAGRMQDGEPLLARAARGSSRRPPSERLGAA